MATQPETEEDIKRWAQAVIRGGNRRATRRKLAYWGSVWVGLAVGVATLLVLGGALSGVPGPRVLGELLLVLAGLVGGGAGGLFYRLVRAPGDGAVWGDDV